MCKQKDITSYKVIKYKLSSAKSAQRIKRNKKINQGARNISDKDEKEENIIKKQSKEEDTEDKEIKKKQETIERHLHYKATLDAPWKIVIDTLRKVGAKHWTNCRISFLSMILNAQRNTIWIRMKFSAAPCDSDGAVSQQSSL